MNFRFISYIIKHHNEYLYIFYTDSFRNTSRTSRFLVRSSPTSMVSFINEMSTLYSSCMLMKTVVEKGNIFYILVVVLKGLV